MTIKQITDEMLLNRFMDEQFSHNGVPVAFPEDIASLRASDLKPALCRDRKDLRHIPCLTIDCDETKDMDDAVSLEQTDFGYLLGVHIADVATYVVPGSRLDEIASERGSSIYLANRTIHMLPPVLSQELCSLNPNEDRNAISVLINITKDGKVLNYSITKSLIRSRVKGVYSEINSIFSHTASRPVLVKYRSFISCLWAMKRLSQALRQSRHAAGADVSASEEVKISIDNGEIQLRLQKQGEAELLIEEFMVLANSLVARYCLEHDLPCLYRTQEEKDTLAKYSPGFSRHADLAIEETGYTHFTSPIRRRCDCFVHAVLTDWLNGKTAAELHEKYGEEYMEEMALLATKRLRRAQTMQKLSSQFCYTRYFSRRYQNLYLGKVIGYNKQKLPIICMDAYPIHVLGSLALGAQIGERYAFHVSANESTRKLYASYSRKVAA